MKKSELLKEAKKRLWEGYASDRMHRYICHAIDEVANYSYDITAEDVACDLKEWIEKLLKLNWSGNTALEGWLEIYHPEFPRNDNVKIQTLRHKWIDWMIEYWESKGE